MPPRKELEMILGAADAQGIALRSLEILAALFLAGPLLIVALRALSRRKAATSPSGGKGLPLFVRYGTLVGLTAAFLVPAYLGELAFSCLVLVIVLVGLGEFWRLLEACGMRPLRELGWLGGAALVAAAHGLGAGSLGIVLGAVLAILLPAALVYGDRSDLTSRLSGTALGILFVALLGSFMILLRQDANGFGRIVFFYCVIEFADVFSLLGGVALGRRKLAPSLSPGKTWAGTVSGFAAALAGGALFRFAVPELRLAEVLAISAALALTALLGGLVASGLKRSAGIKDFGSLLPGHGGILDRFDSSLLSAPVAYLLFRLATDGAIW